MQINTIPIGEHGRMKITSYIPTVVLPSYWIRHQLSRNDIDNIMAYIPTRLVWASAVISGIQCPWFTLRASSATSMGITLAGKAFAVDLLLEEYKIIPSTINKLDLDSVESFDHVPPIPKYVIDRSTFETISRCIVSHLMPRSLLTGDEQIGEIPFLYDFLKIQWVPTGIEGNSICCNRVTIESDFVYNRMGGFTHEPKLGIYNGATYCLTDEVILLSCAT